MLSQQYPHLIPPPAETPFPPPPTSPHAPAPPPPTPPLSVCLPACPPAARLRCTPALVNGLQQALSAVLGTSPTSILLNCVAPPHTASKALATVILRATTFYPSRRQAQNARNMVMAAINTNKFIPQLTSNLPAEGAGGGGGGGKVGWVGWAGGSCGTGGGGGATHSRQGTVPSCRRR